MKAMERCRCHTLFVGATILVAGVGTFAAAQATSSTVQTVPDANALRANTPDEKAVAAFFDIGTGSILARGTVQFGPPMAVYGTDEARTYAQELHIYVCAYPLVVVGHADNKRVMLNAKESYLVTMFGFAVERAIRPIYVPPQIPVAMAGGEVQIQSPYPVRIMNNVLVAAGLTETMRRHLSQGGTGDRFIADLEVAAQSCSTPSPVRQR